MTRTDFLDVFGEPFVSFLICCTAWWGFAWLPVMAGSCIYSSLLLLLQLVCLIIPASGMSSTAGEDFNYEHEEKAAEYGNSPSSIGKATTGWLRERTHNSYDRPETVEEFKCFWRKEFKKKREKKRTTWLILFGCYVDWTTCRKWVLPRSLLGFYSKKILTVWFNT